VEEEEIVKRRKKRQDREELKWKIGKWKMKIKGLMKRSNLEKCQTLNMKRV
jgi:hypothetical protein